MRKIELAKAIAQKTALTTDVVESVIEVAAETIRETLEKGESIYMRGFGTLFVKTRAAKKARDITRGVQISIPAKKTPFFKASKSFVKRLNK